MSESQTPRTDAAAFNLNPDGSIQYSPKGGWVGRDTCEQLETELTATRARLAELEGIADGLALDLTYYHNRGRVIGLVSVQSYEAYKEGKK